MFIYVPVVQRIPEFIIVPTTDKQTKVAFLETGTDKQSKKQTLETAEEMQTGKPLHKTGTDEQTKEHLHETGMDKQTEKPSHETAEDMPSEQPLHETGTNKQTKEPLDENASNSFVEGSTSRQADLQRLAAMVHESALAAMPYEVVESVHGTEAHRHHRIAMEEEIRRALVSLPPDTRNPFSEMVGKIVEKIMDAAHQERREITSRLISQWRTMSSEEKLPWEKQHRMKMEEYHNSLQLYQDGCGPEPQRPPGAYFAWIGEATRSEWARRRNGEG